MEIRIKEMEWKRRMGKFTQKKRHKQRQSHLESALLKAQLKVESAVVVVEGKMLNKFSHFIGFFIEGPGMATHNRIKAVFVVFEPRRS
jgi:hypothetical protein